MFGLDLKSVSRERPVLIAGPTASGKSALAMDLAARDGRLIINADALQVYSNWQVLTARPTDADMIALPHALYGHLARDQAYSVGQWLRDVAPLLGRPVVIVGGTGLYFSALTTGLADIPATPPEVRAQADLYLQSAGLAAMLAEVDPATRAKIDPQNPARVQRAWEVLHATGKGLAAWQADTAPPLLPLDQAEALVLRPDVGWLDDRIARRFAQMIRDGALDEARREAPFYAPALPSAKAIGAPELMEFVAGQITLNEATARATLASRQYAKRQRTWFRSKMGTWRAVALG